MKNYSLVYATAIALSVIIFFPSCKQKAAEDNYTYAAAEMRLEPLADAAYVDLAPPPLRSSLQFSPPHISEEDGNSENDFDIPSPLLISKKIIEDGSISIKVTDIEKSKKEIDGLIKKSNAYYEKEEFENNERKTTYQLKIRIPSAGFETFLSSVENSGGEITWKTIHVNDVTEEFIDVQTRLQNKKLYLKRYSELLTKASSVKDILEIQENIRLLQEEIETKEGRLKYLSDQVAFSTLDVNLFREIQYTFKPEKQDSFTERLKSSVHNGWNAFIEFVLWIIRNWPVLIAILIVVVIWRRYRRNRLKTAGKNGL